MHKIALLAFKKHSLWIKFASKNAISSKHFIYIYRLLQVSVRSELFLRATSSLRYLSLTFSK